MVGDEQVLDVELDRHTQLLPVSDGGGENKRAVMAMLCGPRSEKRDPGIVSDTNAVQSDQNPLEAAPGMSSHHVFVFVGAR